MLRSSFIAALLTAALALGGGAPASAQVIIGSIDAPVMRYVCNYDRWVTGLIGREGALVDAAGISCSQIDLATKSAVRPGWVDMGPHGGEGGRPKSVWCNDGHLPIGVVAAVDPERRIIALKLSCRDYEAVDGRPYAYGRPPAHRVDPQPPFSAVLGGPYQTPPRRGSAHTGSGYSVEFVSECEGFGLMAGLVVWADQYVRGVQVLCR